MQTTQNMDDKYQAVIDEIYGHGRMNDTVDAAYFLACAIKECMTHQDGGDTGYMYEKISKALKCLGMTSVKA